MLLAQQNALYRKQLEAGVKREWREDNPLETPAFDWDWANLPDVKVGGEQQYVTDAFITPGQTTNEDIINQFNWTDEGNAFWDKRLSEMSPEQRNSTHWGSQSSPNSLIHALDAKGAERGYYVDLFNKLFHKAPGDGAEGVPPGYAAPV